MKTRLKWPIVVLSLAVVAFAVTFVGLANTSAFVANQEDAQNAVQKAQTTKDVVAVEIAEVAIEKNVVDIEAIAPAATNQVAKKMVAKKNATTNPVSAKKKKKTADKLADVMKRIAKKPVHDMTA
jgi:hypothetical protein